MTAADSEAQHTQCAVPEELRRLAEQLRPWLEHLAAPPGGSAAGDATAGQADQGPADQGPAGAATGCPLCAVLAAVRGERPEVLLRLAEHGAGLAAAVRDLFTPPAERPATAQARAARTVQHVPVRPAAAGRNGHPASTPGPGPGDPGQSRP